MLLERWGISFAHTMWTLHGIHLMYVSFCTSDMDKDFHGLAFLTGLLLHLRRCNKSGSVCLTSGQGLELAGVTSLKTSSHWLCKDVSLLEGRQWVSESRPGTQMPRLRPSGVHFIVRKSWWLQQGASNISWESSQGSVQWLRCRLGHAQLMEASRSSPSFAWSPAAH